MEEEELFYERLMVVASINSPWARRRKISIGDLINEQWILAPHEVDPGAPVFEGFRAAGHEIPRVNIMSYSLSLRYGLLTSGNFITAIPGSAIHFGPMRKLLKVLPVKLPAWQRPVVMVTLKHRSRSPAADVLMNCLRELSMTLRSG
jgi:DNA-binding transcriptional LysR family regulator